MPAKAIFAEAWCSGRSLRNVISRIGGASNCLRVYVADDELVVTPNFPFDLLFLPEIFGLELRAPLSSIASVTEVSNLIGQTLRVEFAGGRPATVELRLRNPEGFKAALSGGEQGRQRRTG